MNNIVIIPVYKETLSSFEAISLQQAFNIFGHARIMFVAPHKMQSFLQSKGYKAECFADDNFKSVRAYSSLLLTPVFYERFSAYDYMLIYQLDAFAFSDKLDTFAAYGYDYIGAPWPKPTLMCRYSHNPVGNGGFSLRHIRHTIELLYKHQDILNDFIENHHSIIGEDAFFSFCGRDARCNFTTAPAEVAKGFALAHDYQKTFAKFPDTIPFGCHGWYNLNFMTWKPLIEKYGYKLEDPSNVIDSHTVRMNTVLNYLYWRITERDCDVTGLRNYLLSWFNGYSISVWGVGIVGERVIALLKKLNIPVKYIYDSNAKIYNGKKTHYLDNTLLEQDNKIIIATVKYAKEVKAQICRYDKKSVSRLVVYNDFIKYIFKYYVKMWSKAS